MKAEGNVAKHAVTFDEASTVFGDPLALSILDRDHSMGEERWIALGASNSGNLALVVHTWMEVSPEATLVRIISARRPTGRRLGSTARV